MSGRAHRTGIGRPGDRVGVGRRSGSRLPALEYSQVDVRCPTHQAEPRGAYVGVGDVEPSITRLGTADGSGEGSCASGPWGHRADLQLYARREWRPRACSRIRVAGGVERPSRQETNDHLSLDAVKRDWRASAHGPPGRRDFGSASRRWPPGRLQVLTPSAGRGTVPTTVWRSSFRNFRERMARFRACGVLSRPAIARTTAWWRRGTGETDIFFGTPRLLSKT